MTQNSDDGRVGPRQAVVLIHGIGEQRPMATLRAFVRWLLPCRDSYYSKPDQIADSFELRRIKLKKRRNAEASEADPNADWPETDFYEYYWAHQMQGTTFSHVVRWLIRVSATVVRHRKSKEVGWFFRPGCRGPLVGTALVLVASIPITVILALKWPGHTFVAVAFGAAALKLLGMLGRFVLLDVVGDAARYLDVHPSNVARRYDILRGGLSMLRKLHEAHDELRGQVRYRYGRVVLVGHSLGSVIAYDIVKHYWVEVNGKLKVEGRSGELLNAVAGYNPPPKATTAPSDTHEDSDTFRQDQAHAWVSMNEATSAESILSKKGLPHARWLVTDLVTLGSPLAYAHLLLADGPKDFDDKVSSRELPTCPPDRSTTVNRGYYTVPLSTEAQPMGDDYDIIHHAAPFAITRWTNVHLKNDPVGYCLGEVLGKGIKDIQVCDPDGPSMFEAHNLYWPPGACDSGWKHEVRHEMLAILKGPERSICQAVAKVLCEARSTSQTP